MAGSERLPLQIGDTARHKTWWPDFPDVTVEALSTCGDDGCTEPTIGFLDPESGDYDEAHASEFRRVDPGNAVPE